MASIVSGITTVWSAIMTWVITTFPDVIGIFYNSTDGFTFLGVMCLISLGLGIFFLLVRVVQNFVHLRT